ncbi:MAG: C4-type zinc ribbon domain-containing protein [Chthoniobacteraceae bacterium]
MRPEIERLLVLQDRDRKIRTLKLEQKAAPLERKDLDNKLSAANLALETAKLKSKENEVERKKLELDAQTKRDQIAKLQTQKFQTRKNEEFQAFNNEITRFESDVRAIEDQELELMEAAEKLKAAAAEAEKNAQATRASVQRQLADLEAKAEALQVQLDEIEKDRNTLAGAVDEDLFDTYQRLFANKGEAVVPLEHDVCTGCHMKVIAQTSVSVKGGRSIVHCENCGRILYPGES